MAKVHESLRIEETITDRVKAQAREGESKAATYSRVLEVGLESLEGDTQTPEETSEDEIESLKGYIETLEAQLSEQAIASELGTLKAQLAEEAAANELKTLRDYVETLKAQVSEKDIQLANKDKQLAEKDKQLEGLTRITEQAQTLHAFTETKNLEPPQEQQPPERLTLGQRFKRFIGIEQEG